MNIPQKNYFVLAVHVFMVCLHVTINHMYNVSKNQLCAFFGPAIEIPCCNYLSLLLSYTVGLLLAVLCSYCTKIVTLFLFFFFQQVVARNLNKIIDVNYYPVKEVCNQLCFSERSTT